MIRALKFFGLLAINLVVALIGTAILDTAFGKVFPARSLLVLLWKEWILNIACAAFFGFVMWRAWRSAAAKWMWVLPAMWFVLRFLPTLLGRGSQSVLASGSIWSQFSGADCETGIQALGCRNFFVFTIPLIRGISYSVGAFFSSLASQPKRQPASEPSKIAPTFPPTGE